MPEREDARPGKRAVWPSELTASHNVLLTIHRRDGSSVGTPVWAACDDRALFVWSETASYKAKRIQRNDSVTVATCTFRRTTTGEAIAGKETLLAEATAHTRRFLARRYGALAVRWPWPSYFRPSAKLVRDTVTGNRSDSWGIRIVPASRNITFS